MKHMIKRAMAVLLVVCMMAAMFAVPAAATEATLAESLVTHYDFKGDTFADALKDKATNGAAQDDLSMESRDAAVTPAETDFTWDKENGTLANLNNTVGLKTELSDDFKVNSANGTYFFRFQVNGGEGEEVLFDIRTSDKRALAIGYKVDGAKLNVYAGWSGGNKNTQTLGVYDAETKPFVNIAVSFAKVESNTVVKYYLAVDGGNGWTMVTEQTMAGGAWEVDATTVPRVFGTCFGAGAKVRFVADDIRIYSKVLSDVELQTVLYEFTPEAFAPKMEDGAAVRLVANSQGIRFTSAISEATLTFIDSIKDAGTAVTVGTVIAPVDYVNKATAFTMEELDKITVTGTKYVNVVATDDGKEVKDGVVTFNAALVNLKGYNHTRVFAARSYVQFTVDGETVILYSDYSEANNARSMSAVADAALKDLKDAEDAENGYTFEVGGKWSCYNEAERTALNGYLTNKQ